MMKTVFLNSGKVNFDEKLDYSPLTNLSTVTSYHSSNHTEILTRVKGHDIVITKEIPLGKELIRDFPPCVKLICEAGTGFNNIDMDAAKEKGITVCNIPGYSTDSVAQLAVTLMLSLSSSITRQQNMLYSNNHDNFTKYLQVPHFELRGKTLGIIGAGTIGQRVITVALALGMKILTYNRNPKTWDDPNIKSVNLDELLVESDFVSIHCPLTPGTKHLIDMDKLNVMKPTAYLINTSRGAIIKETDLVIALQEGRLAGAALDVQDPEPPSPTNPLFSMDNVILTPHIGWQTFEARQRLIGLLADNIEAFILGKPVNVVS